MENEEENELNGFLNNKEIPTHDDIINFFFDGIDEASIFDGEEIAEVIDFDELGEADEVKTANGSEWIATRLCWNTDDGKVYKINLIKIIHDNDNDIKSPYGVKPIYPYGREITDYDEANPLTFTELLDEAIEIEDFEEAARLRDWNIALTELLLSLKPKIVEAIDKEKVKALDDLLTQIRVFRNTMK